MTKLQKMIGFLATSKPDEARRFFGEKLGFRLVSDDSFALVFDANGTTLRVVKAKSVTPPQGTVLGWEVVDIVDAVKTLKGSGATFERYPGMPQDEDGIWTAPGGGKVAWFKDQDGNVLSVAQHVNAA